jgi:hypothetical protein
MAYNSYKTESRINERDILIEEMKQNNTERSQRIDTLVRTIAGDITYKQGDKTMTSHELVLYVNNLDREIMSLKDSLSYYKAYYNMSQKQYNNEFKVEEVSPNRLRYVFVGKVPDSTQYASLNKELLEALNENAKMKVALNKYNITIKESKDDYIITDAPQIDSALALLPFYRDKIKLSKDGKKWIITYTAKE